MNNKFLVIFAALLACAWAYNRYEPSYVRFETSDEDEVDHHVDDSKSNAYSFEYEVNEGSNNFGHRQKSDGKVTSGSYRVQLPDGRTQIVTYRADENGYNAKVTYENTKYTAPPAAPSYYNPHPAAYNVYKTQSAPLKPLIFRNNNSPFYESPSIAPYGAAYDHVSSTTPSSNDGGEDSDEESADRLSLAPLAFRKKEDKVDSPYVYRSGYGKRSPIDVWNEEDIIRALDSHPAIVKEVVANEETPSSVNEQVEFDHLPFPLPVPLAFRSDAI